MRKIIEIENAFISLGFSFHYLPENKNANGPDLWVEPKKGRPLSVEIKHSRVLKNGTIQVPPVSPMRRNDDLIAIVINDYVLIEPMKDHLKSCSPNRTRQLTLMRS